MFGEHDPAFAWGETFLVLELAFRDALLPLGGGCVGFAGEFAVEPVLDFAGFDADFTVVPFANGLQRFLCDGLFNVVDGRGGVGSAAEAVGVSVVVNHLVFDAQPLFTSDFGDPELDAVVSFRAEFPVPFEFEIGVFVFGDECACTFSREVDGSVGLGGPACRGFVAAECGEIGEGEFHGIRCNRAGCEHEGEEEGTHSFDEVQMLDLTVGSALVERTTLGGGDRFSCVQGGESRFGGNAKGTGESKLLKDASTTPLTCRLLLNRIRF